MSEPTRDELVSAALDGDADALEAVHARPDLLEQLETLRAQRDRLSRHAVEAPAEVREANIAAALAAFDDMQAEVANEAPAAVVDLSQRRRWHDRLRTPAAGLGTAAAVAVAAILVITNLNGATDDSVADGGADSADETAFEPSSEPPLASTEAIEESTAARALDDGAGDADDTMTADADAAAEVEGVDGDDAAAVDVAESATTTTAAPADTADVDDGGTQTGPAAETADFGALDDRFVACRAELEADPALPTRTWRESAPQHSTPTSEVTTHVDLVVRDDLGVMYGISFEPEGCILEHAELLTEE